MLFVFFSLQSVPGSASSNAGRSILAKPSGDGMAFGVQTLNSPLKLVDALPVQTPRRKSTVLRRGPGYFDYRGRLERSGLEEYYAPTILDEHRVRAGDETALFQRYGAAVRFEGALCDVGPLEKKCWDAVASAHNLPPPTDAQIFAGIRQPPRDAARAEFLWEFISRHREEGEPLEAGKMEEEFLMELDKNVAEETARIWKEKREAERHEGQEAHEEEVGEGGAAEGSEEAETSRSTEGKEKRERDFLSHSLVSPFNGASKFLDTLKKVGVPVVTFSNRFTSQQLMQMCRVMALDDGGALGDRFIGRETKLPIWNPLDELALMCAADLKKRPSSVAFFTDSSAQITGARRMGLRGVGMALPFESTLLRRRRVREEAEALREQTATGGAKGVAAAAAGGEGYASAVEDLSGAEWVLTDWADAKPVDFRKLFDSPADFPPGGGYGGHGGYVPQPQPQPQHKAASRWDVRGERRMCVAGW
uniref:Uncharacterized protein n=1 Tax=Chromera velia CCMP2878 TaxID=1169474 RepID=A0A0G4FND3_9ALVE|eukprot:Cvel_17942.t1-p1 / transcript=Cvel_17942.t1 / gene=Cvel_17942 / organism=Chromera_velia_CCMP2878 / gene_product=hypothetical protein / transcript_product=hypothetical protein / location=Cvel_scaffold1458:36489-41536(-) / protein_length=476 / sequence_SO=supercontig / SO=protein_coding / is_pseudo=false